MKLTIVLVAALAISGPAAGQRPTDGVPIQLYSYGYSPSPIVLSAGVPVTLVFTDVAGTSHEFKAPAFFHNARIVTGDVEQEGSVDLKPHQTLSVTLVPARGTYEVHCGHFFHDQLGMHSLIYVR